MYTPYTWSIHIYKVHSPSIRVTHRYYYTFLYVIRSTTVQFTAYHVYVYSHACAYFSGRTSLRRYTLCSHVSTTFYELIDIAVSVGRLYFVYAITGPCTHTSPSWNSWYPFMSPIYNFSYTHLEHIPKCVARRHAMCTCVTQTTCPGEH